jgi:hypothetical protein
MKTWPLAASAVLLMLTSGCKTVLDYGHNPGGGGGPGHPWAAQWTPAAPPPPPVAQTPPPPAPAPVEVAPVPAPVIAPGPAPEPPRAPIRNVPRRERG